MVEVIQADRDAAAALWFNTVDATDANFDIGHNIRIGNSDDDKAVQAFARHRIEAQSELQATVVRLEAMLVDDPNDASAGVPEAVIEAGIAVQDRANEDHRNYVSGETTDWDEGMLAAAIFKAMLRSALSNEGEG